MLILFGFGDVTLGKTFVVGVLAGFTWMAWYGIVMTRLLARAANGSRLRPDDSIRTCVATEQ